MKNCITVTIISLLWFTSNSQSIFVSTGLDIRTYPIDIENVPPGPNHGDASFYSEKFWKPLSVRMSLGKELSKNWSAQLSNVVRYNHSHWKYGINFNLTPPSKRPEEKSFKFDILLDLERGMKLFHSTKNNFRAQFGIGLINLNSNFDVMIRDTFPSGLSELRHYKGNFTRISPHLGLGYKLDRMKLLFDFYLVEGSTFQNLSSLWMGMHLDYELWRE